MEPVWGLGRVILYPLRPVFRIRMTGREQVPREGAVILAGNHVSVLDPLFMLWLGERTHRKPRFLAMAELWDHRAMRFFMVNTHMIPVPRDNSAAAGSLAAAARALQSGECVAIYPEGKVSEDFEPMPGKTGVARLAALTGVPVTPVGVWGGHRLWPKGRKRRLRPGVGISIAVGEPVHVGPDEDAFDATDRIMEGVAGTVATARRIYPQQPTRGDDGWWVRAPESAVMRPARRARTRDRWS
ncbi:MAG: lysophospholipid acyltransferase family protein [Candidatus Rokuibacteriota bacterium]